jgi:hypothetical protein
VPAEGEARASWKSRGLVSGAATCPMGLPRPPLPQTLHSENLGPFLSGCCVEHLAPSRGADFPLLLGCLTGCLLQSQSHCGSVT